ncbi:exocyst complex component Sec5-domain-containing protein [Kalaharituber pfeilii]|nr:exocyst complex component Sec5-domain-containing protein [Kalaharituber pfeilii]
MDATVARHYRLTEPFPQTWSDPIEDSQIVHRKATKASTARYSVLQEEGMSLRSGGNTLDSTVPQDEADPLGMTSSVVRVLRQKGLPVDDNLKLRNRYLISSKTFSPAAFLRDVHSNDSTEALSRGLEYLTRSIDQKSESLKVLVENNFDRFVAAKATIEGVYTEMKQTNLNREKEWGLAGIKAPLTEAGRKADEIFGPVIENRGKEEKYRMAVAIVEKYRSYLELPNSILDAIKRKDYDLLIEEYQKARKWVTESRALISKVAKLQEQQIHQIIIAEKIWAEVTNIVEEFKRDTWKRLVDTKQEDNFLELISILLELGVEDNPIWVWLLSRYDYLKNKITRTFERARVEIEVLRRKVSQAPPPSHAVIAMHLRSSFRRIPIGTLAMDTPEIIALWELINTSLTTILSPQGGILSEVLTFWETAQSFIDGKTQATLPVGIDDQSRKHHRLSEDGIKDLRAGALELITLIRDNMLSFFQDPPIEDISSIYSPVPDTPSTTVGSVPPTPGSADGSLAPFSPLPLRTGKHGLVRKVPGDEYAFLPPWANSLGGVHYLSRMLTLLGNAASLLSELPIGTSLAEKLKSMIVIARERCVNAVCIGWLRDAQNCKVLEDWTRSPENRDVTKMPAQFLQVEAAVITGMQKLLYMSEVKNKPSSEIIPPPSQKLLTHVRGQFVRSLYKALQGMLENTKRPMPTEDWDAEKETLASPVASVAPRNLKSGMVDQNDKNVRVLLTLSNLHLLKSELIPQLISQFESAFSIQLTDESKTIRDALTQLDEQLFTEYTRPHLAHLTNLITTSILSPHWCPPTAPLPRSVRPYIHASLLHLVHVHTEVATTSPSLTTTIVSYLAEKICELILDSFTKRLDGDRERGIKREPYTLPQLLQATLDTEFVGQMLGTQYTTAKAQEFQHAVYKVLDRGSSDEARAGLQKELGSIKAVLQKERRGTRAEFLCFRTSKKPSASSKDKDKDKDSTGSAPSSMTGSVVRRRVAED